MSCYIQDRRIVIGRTKRKAIITVCKNCSAYWIPHFNYISKKYEVTFSLLSPSFVDTFENIELADRTDVEEFLNTIVDIDSVKKTNNIINKLNGQFFRQQKRDVKKYKVQIATIDNGNKFFGVEIKDIDTNMTYWELIIKLWNKYNKEQTPTNLCKPYYRNFIEYIDIARFTDKEESEKYLNGGMCYIKQDQERTPHFYYQLSTGEEFCIMFEKAEYMQPIKRKLSQKELDNLVSFLNAKSKQESPFNKWQIGVGLWNNQNYEYNENSPKWFPQYKRILETMIPDYTKLNCDKFGK